MVEGIHVAEVGILVEAVVHILVEGGTPVEVDIQAQAVRTLLSELDMEVVCPTWLLKENRFKNTPPCF